MGCSLRKPRARRYAPAQRVTVDARDGSHVYFGNKSGIYMVEPDDNDEQLSLKLGTIVNTLVTEKIEAGDVVEFVLDGGLVSALVLLAADESLILDLCDGETPIVAKLEEINGLRRFSPDVADLIAA